MKQYLAPILLVVLLLAASILLPNTAAARLRLPAAIKALMYQPHTTDLQQGEEWWQETMDRLQKLRVKDLYIQWSRHGDVDFTKKIAPLSEPLISLLLRQAEAHGMRLHIGLYADPDFFSRTKQSLPALAVYLNRLRLLSLEQAQRVGNLAQDSPAFAGLYLYEEIDDVTWRSREKQALLARHLQKSFDGLHERFPGKQISISTFFTARMTPEGFAEMWQRLTRENSLIVLVQDGAGSGRLVLDERMLYFKALERKLRADQWGIIVELFRQKPGEGEFTADTVPASAISQEIHQIKKLHTLPAVAFSLRYLIPFPEASD